MTAKNAQFREGSMPLSERRCEACEGGVPVLSKTEISGMLKDIGEGWGIVDDHHLKRLYRFKDFASALDFANRVGAVAEEEGHHPEITIGWGRAEIELFTHSVDGLTQNDFILAAKISALRLPSEGPH